MLEINSLESIRKEMYVLRERHSSDIAFTGVPGYHDPDISETIHFVTPSLVDLNHRP